MVSSICIEEDIAKIVWVMFMACCWMEKLYVAGSTWYLLEERARMLSNGGVYKRSNDL